MQPEEFTREVVKAYEDGRGLFSNKVNAEDLLPSDASGLEKARFLFYVIPLDYATRSQRLYCGARWLYEADKRYFDPYRLIKLSNKELQALMVEYLKPRYVNEAILRWRKNSKLLVESYGGDPRVVFEKLHSAKEVLDKVRKFRGFGPKIGNFFVRTMINTFGYEFKDIEEILPPVDTWDVKIAHLLGYVESQKMTSKNVKEVKNLWSRACRSSGVSWLTFDKALWLLGSEGKPKNKEDISALLSG
jgi:N-glycosylase/DNA lyase